MKELFQIEGMDTDGNLIELGIDSLNFIRLIVELEDDLNIVIQDEDIKLDNFTSINDIIDLLQKYVNTRE
jgi:acyl carrier protein